MVGNRAAAIPANSRPDSSLQPSSDISPRQSGHNPGRSRVYSYTPRKNFLISAPALQRLQTSPRRITMKATPSSSVPVEQFGATSIASSARSPTSLWSTQCQRRPSIRMCVGATETLPRLNCCITEAPEYLSCANQRTKITLRNQALNFVVGSCGLPCTRKQGNTSQYKQKTRSSSGEMGLDGSDLPS